MNQNIYRVHNSFHSTGDLSYLIYCHHSHVPITLLESSLRGLGTKSNKFISFWFRVNIPLEHERRIRLRQKICFRASKPSLVLHELKIQDENVA